MHTAISLCKLHVFTSVIFVYLEPNKLEDQIDNKTVDDDQDENDEQEMKGFERADGSIHFRPVGDQVIEHISVSS